MVYIDSITICPEEITIAKGKWYYDVCAEAYPTNADCKEVIWHSENPSVASVNAASGYIYAEAVGTTKIYATATDGSGCSDYLTVTVSEAVKVVDVALSKDYLHMETGTSYTLTATVTPSNATNRTLAWQSSDPSVATVENGTVSALWAGNTIITATATDGSGASGCCEVWVTNSILVKSVTVEPSGIITRVGKARYVHAYVCPDNAINKEIEWWSANPEVATINPTSGLVLGQGVGKTMIYAKATDGSNIYGFCTVEVLEPIPVESIQVIPNDLVLKIGDKYVLNTEISPIYATNNNVTWQSSNSNVVSVTEFGVIEALNSGMANITATTKDGGHQSTCCVHVYCGGANYRDVTQHTLELQEDGYYVCTKCGYRIPSPALQDKDILSEEDYYKILACAASIPYYAKIDNEEAGAYSIKATALRLIIDDIRSKTQYSQKYEYVGSDGIYKREYTIGHENDDYNMPVSINYNVIDNSLELLLNNGVASGVIELIIGWKIPSKYQFLFFDLTDGYANLTDFLCNLAEKAGCKEFSILLKLILFGSTINEMGVTDKVVDIQFSVGAGVYTSKTVFDSNGNLKFQEHA